MFDWSTWTFAGGNGRHFDATISGLLNADASLTGGVHTTLGTTLDAQFHSFLGALGLGSRNGFVSQSGEGGQGRSKGVGSQMSSSGSRNSVGSGLSGWSGGMGFLDREFSLYAAGDGGVSSGDLQENLGNITDAAKQGKRALEGVGGVYGFDILPSVRPMGPPGRDQPDPAGSPTPAQRVGEEANPQANPKPEAKQPDTKPSADAGKKATEAAQNAGKQGTEAEPKPKPEKSKPLPADAPTNDNRLIPKGGYFDPDQQAYTSLAVSSPEQIEMRLNGRKRPVTSNTDGGQPQLDTSSPPPHHGGIDPTLARFDGEVYGGVSLERAEMKTSIAPIDYHRDHEPPTPTRGWTGAAGGGDSDRDLGWP